MRRLEAGCGRECPSQDVEDIIKRIDEHRTGSSLTRHADGRKPTTTIVKSLDNHFFGS